VPPSQEDIDAEDAYMYLSQCDATEKIIVSVRWVVLVQGCALYVEVLNNDYEFRL